MCINQMKLKDELKSIAEELDNKKKKKFPVDVSS